MLAVALRVTETRECIRETNERVRRQCLLVISNRETNEPPFGREVPMKCLVDRIIIYHPSVPVKESRKGSLSSRICLKLGSCSFVLQVQKIIGAASIRKHQGHGEEDERK